MPRSRGGRRRASSDRDFIVEILEGDVLIADQHDGSLGAPLGAEVRATTSDLSGGEGAIPELLYRAEDLDRWPQEKIEALGRRLIAVQALAALPQRSKRDVAAAARELGVNVATVYRDLSRLQGRGTLRDLAPRKGGYLRHEASRHGLLLLIHQHRRPRGWTFDDRAALQPWSVVLQHLEGLAMVTRRANPNGPQPTVRCIDVSTVVPRKKKPRG